MQQVHFYGLSEVEQDRLKFAIIMARYQGKWIFVRHKERTTWEIPGGHREIDEDIACTAGRELYEETGATKYKIVPVSVYSVVSDGLETFGQLFFAEVEKIDALPGLEIAEIKMFDTMPGEMTYPYIQPVLFEKVSKNTDGLLAGLAI